MLRIAIVILSLLALPLAHAADNGLVSKKSPYDVNETLDRLEAVIKKKGITIFARIDHAAGAKKVEMELRPTQLLIFGNPKLGTPPMTSNQAIGLDLPLKVLAWEDADGQVWITYSAPADLAKRYAITDQQPVFDKMTNVLDMLTSKAVAAE